MQAVKPDEALVDVADWIRNRVQRYEESPRAGIPRGDELPVPKHKYRAALLQVIYGSPRCSDLEMIAREVGCTYSLLGKWRTERRFMALAERAADEYLDGFLKTYIRLAEDVKTDEKAARLMGDILKIVATEWGEILFDRVYDKLNKLLRKNGLSTQAKYHIYFLVIGCARHWKDEKLKAEMVQRCKELHGATVEGFKLAAKQSLEKGDKVAVSEILDVLGNWAIEGNSDFLDVAFGVRGKEDR